MEATRAKTILSSAVASLRDPTTYGRTLETQGIGVKEVRAHVGVVEWQRGWVTGALQSSLAGRPRLGMAGLLLGTAHVAIAVEERGEIGDRGTGDVGTTIRGAGTGEVGSLTEWWCCAEELG
jgi:hypothetical protein